VPSADATLTISYGAVLAPQRTQVCSVITAPSRVIAWSERCVIVASESVVLCGRNGHGTGHRSALNRKDTLSIKNAWDCDSKRPWQ
jgi:hypothetical protein